MINTKRVTLFIGWINAALRGLSTNADAFEQKEILTGGNEIGQHKKRVFNKK